MDRSARLVAPACPGWIHVFAAVICSLSEPAGSPADHRGHDSPLGHTHPELVRTAAARGMTGPSQKLADTLRQIYEETAVIRGLLYDQEMSNSSDDAGGVF